MASLHGPQQSTCWQMVGGQRYEITSFRMVLHWLEHLWGDLHEPL